MPTQRFPDLPSWEFQTEETSYGVYRVTGVDSDGRQVSRNGTDPDELMSWCRESAADINGQIERRKRERFGSSP
jgi:hypothetical protein